MARRPVKTKFVPQHPEKYAGDVHNIICRSGWERALCVWLDQNPNVVKWASESIMIPYVIEGETGRKTPHRYFPDFLIEILDKTGSKRVLLVEVKPKKETRPPVQGKRKKKSTLLQEQLTYVKNQAKWEAAERWCKRHGAEFAVWTEDHLVNLGVRVAR